MRVTTIDVAAGTTTVVSAPIAELRTETKARLRDEAWGRVDETVDPREQTALLALLARATLAIATGQPVDTEALADLTTALDAVEQILADWPAVEAAIDAATTLAELDAITMPETARVPPVSAAAIAAKLRRGGA